MSLDRRVGLVALVFSGLILWAALVPENLSVYVFPIFWAGIMVVFSLALIWRAFSTNEQDDTAKQAAGTLPLSQAVKRLAPAIGVFLAYLFLMANLGFYLSAWLAFSGLATLYGPRPISASRLFVHGALGAGFVAILYLLFSYLLAVQPPAGWLF